MPGTITTPDMLHPHACELWFGIPGQHGSVQRTIEGQVVLGIVTGAFPCSMSANTYLTPAAAAEVGHLLIAQAAYILDQQAAADVATDAIAAGAAA